MDKIKQQNKLLLIFITSLLISYSSLSYSESEFNGEVILFPFAEAKYSSNLDSASSLDEDEYEITKRPALEGAIDSMLEYFSIKRVEAFDEYYKTVSNIGGIFVLLFCYLYLFLLC